MAAAKRRGESSLVNKPSACSIDDDSLGAHEPQRRIADQVAVPLSQRRVQRDCVRGPQEFVQPHWLYAQGRELGVIDERIVTENGKAEWPKPSGYGPSNPSGAD
jgi:hypothetical protein